MQSEWECGTVYFRPCKSHVVGASTDSLSSYLKTSCCLKTADADNYFGVASAWIQLHSGRMMFRGSCTAAPRACFLVSRYMYMRSYRPCMRIVFSSLLNSRVLIIWENWKVWQMLYRVNPKWRRAKKKGHVNWLPKLTVLHVNWLPRGKLKSLTNAVPG